jgi:hypothetical protein
MMLFSILNRIPQTDQHKHRITQAHMFNRNTTPTAQVHTKGVRERAER